MAKKRGKQLGKLPLIVLAVVAVLFLGGLSLQFFRSNDPASGFAINIRNAEFPVEPNAFSSGLACSRNSQCKSNICNNRKCVDCLSDRNCRERYYCDASKNCVPKVHVLFPCKADNECRGNVCYDSVCYWDRPCVSNDDCMAPSDDCINNQCRPQHAGLAGLPSVRGQAYSCERHTYNNGIVNFQLNQELDKSIRQQIVHEYYGVGDNVLGDVVGGMVDVCASTSQLLQAECRISNEEWYVETTCANGETCKEGVCKKLLFASAAARQPLVSRIRAGFSNLFKR